jgi:hypothetical protein
MNSQSNWNQIQKLIFQIDNAFNVSNFLIAFFFNSEMNLANKVTHDLVTRWLYLKRFSPQQLLINAILLFLIAFFLIKLRRQHLC